MVLIAGIGNIFFGDDAFGVEVIGRLRHASLPHGVEARDFGIRGIDLLYALLDEKLEAAILVDAVSRGGAPGTIYVIEPAEEDPRAATTAGATPMLAAHDLNPFEVFRLARSMGSTARALIVGCEPESLGTENGEDGTIGLSACVAEAADGAVARVVALAAELVQVVGPQSLSGGGGSGTAIEPPRQPRPQVPPHAAFVERGTEHGRY